MYAETAADVIAVYSCVFNVFTAPHRYRSELRDTTKRVPTSPHPPPPVRNDEDDQGDVMPLSGQSFEVFLVFTQVYGPMESRLARLAMQQDLIKQSQQPACGTPFVSRFFDAVCQYETRSLVPASASSLVSHRSKSSTRLNSGISLARGADDACRYMSHEWHA